MSGNDREYFLWAPPGRYGVAGQDRAGARQQRLGTATLLRPRHFARAQSFEKGRPSRAREPDARRADVRAVVVSGDRPGSRARAAPVGARPLPRPGRRPFASCSTQPLRPGDGWLIGTEARNPWEARRRISTSASLLPDGQSAAFVDALGAPERRGQPGGCPLVSASRDRRSPGFTLSHDRSSTSRFPSGFQAGTYQVFAFIARARGHRGGEHPCRRLPGLRHSATS